MRHSLLAVVSLLSASVLLAQSSRKSHGSDELGSAHLPGPAIAGAVA